jgi:hypothetical protein
MNSIKDYRNKELVAYIIANALVLLIILNIFDLKEMLLSSENISKIINSFLITSCLSVFAYLGDSVLSGDIKDKLVDLWRGRPGGKIFTKMKDNNKDIRFTNKQVLEKYTEVYSNLPTTPKERYQYENSKWYSIYHRHQKVKKIYNANRDYLLCRDMHVATYVMTALYIAIGLLSSAVDVTWQCVLYEVVFLIVTNVAARQKAKRLVYNVIAYDLQQKEMPKNYLF